jgi:hypothetical protein
LVSAILATEKKEYTNKEPIRALYIPFSVSWLKFHKINKYSVPVCTNTKLEDFCKGWEV